MTSRSIPIWQRAWKIAAQHPAPTLAILETSFWLAVIWTLALHLLDSRNSPVAFVIWALTIGPHEIGHIICIPFGWFLNVAGGSIWQILVFALPALYAFLLKRQISASLVFWAMTGHSFISLAPYIADARARELPLIMGLGKEHHDWWNLLRDLGLLEYDLVLAALAETTGAGIILLAAGMGILTAWALPRRYLGMTPRYEGNFWRALRKQLSENDHPKPLGS